MMFPRWVSWLFLLFMGYLIYMGTHGSHTHPAPVSKPTESAPLPTTDLTHYPKLEAFTNGNRWQRALNPEFVGTAKIVDTTPGQGEPAQCADRVTIHLRGTLADGANFDETHEESKPLTFRLGDAPYAVLNGALIGLREGGVRQITAPPQQVFADGTHTTHDDVLLRVTLDHLDVPPTAAHAFGTRVYVDALGAGDAATCGAPIKLRLTLWNEDGGVAYETPQPITITLGKDALPASFAEGLASMRQGEIRTLILPPQTDEKLAHSPLPSKISAVLHNKTLTLLSAQRVE